MISYQTDGVEMPAIKKSQTTEWIKAVAATYGKRVGEIAYIFCSDEKILEVNRQYLQPPQWRFIYQPRHGTYQCRTVRQ